MNSDDELDELFTWFQGVPGSLEKFKAKHRNEHTNDEIIQNIGLSLGIQDDTWKAMTHDERLLTIYNQLPYKDKLEFKKAATHLFQENNKDNQLDRFKNIYDGVWGGGDKRNKSKKPKRHNSRSKRSNSRSKRRNSRSKRRKTVSKRRR